MEIVSGLRGICVSMCWGNKRHGCIWLYLGEHSYNTTHHMSIDMSPFRALYGYDALFFVDLALSDNKAPLEQAWLHENQDIMSSLRESL